MERSRDSRSPPLNMYGYKSRCRGESRRNKPPNEAPCRFLAWQGATTSPLSPLEFQRFLSVPFRTRYVSINLPPDIIFFGGPTSNNTPERAPRSHTAFAFGYGRKGVSHGRRTCPLSQIFLPLTATTRLPVDHNGLDDRSLLSSSRCICSVAYLP